MTVIHISFMKKVKVILREVNLRQVNTKLQKIGSNPTQSVASKVQIPNPQKLLTNDPVRVDSATEVTVYNNTIYQFRFLFVNFPLELNRMRVIVPFYGVGSGGANIPRCSRAGGASATFDFRLIF